MLKNRTLVTGAALVGAVLTGVLIWDWNGLPSTADTPKASLKRLSPGILSLALESGDASAAGLALQGDGTIVVGGTAWVPAPHKTLGVVVRLTSNGRLANPAVTLLADAETIVSGVSTAPDGTILVVGYGASGGLSATRHFRVARLLPNGVLDPAFGRHGMTSANMRSSIIWWLGDAA
ncbi:MAG TPA: delta-60 repeat domain-containing protein, partial [Nitrospira sp.]|nr:delta-60 repeat domain-containing protein [Nitrospira sp.]